MPVIAATPESIAYAYRLFLDREPENSQVIDEKLIHLKTSQDVRREFLHSGEFKEKNPGVHTLTLSGYEPAITVEDVTDLRPLFSHIQKVWENFGETEPYWSVLASDEFKTHNIAATKQQFYDSGFTSADLLFKTLDRLGIDRSHLKTCLEYGCGLGRVTGALAKTFDHVSGYDISRSHLRIAQRHFDETGITNVSLHHVGSPQAVENFPKVDVVYSVIVLQHNPPPVIQFIVREFLRALNPGGVAFFQVPTYRAGYAFSLQDYLTNQATRGEMEMHLLPQNRIFDIAAQEQGQLVAVVEDNMTGLRPGERSNTFVIQKLTSSSGSKTDGAFRR